MSAPLDVRVINFLAAVGATIEEFHVAVLEARIEHVRACGNSPSRLTVTDAAQGIACFMSMDVDYGPIGPRAATVSSPGYQTDVTW